MILCSRVSSGELESWIVGPLPKLLSTLQGCGLASNWEEIRCDCMIVSISLSRGRAKPSLHRCTNSGADWTGHSAAHVLGRSGRQW